MKRFYFHVAKPLKIGFKKRTFAPENGFAGFLLARIGCGPVKN